MANIGGALRTWIDDATPASKRHFVREEPSFASLSVPALKPLFTHGLTRGTILEICGGATSGKTATYLHVLAKCTQAGETCAVVDLFGCFDPFSALKAGIELDQLVWVRCAGNAEHAMKAADLIVHAGGFGAVLLDISDVSPKVLNRMPLSYWYRFRRAIANTPTVLIVVTSSPQAKSCASNGLYLENESLTWIGSAPFSILGKVNLQGKLKQPGSISQRAMALSNVA